MSILEEVLLEIDADVLNNNEVLLEVSVLS